jgi:hypothetical protein
MKMRYMMVLLGVMLLGTGISFAISGAVSVNKIGTTHWSGDTAANDVTEGGNITNLDINGTSLTDRWAAYYGLVTGDIALRDAADNYVFKWTWAPTDGGDVCLTTGSAYNFAGAVAATTAGIDTAWSFTSGADQAADTFVGTCSDLNFSQGVVTTPIKITHLSPSTFMTCAIKTAAGAAKANFAFCTPIQDHVAVGKSYKNTAADYEVMVPTSDASGTATETYYFYMQLN